MRKTRRFFAITAGTLLAAACGARTGLYAPEEIEAGVDAHHDAHNDVEAEADAADEDVLPPIDAVVPDVAVPTDCPDSGSTLIYVLGANNDLYSFYPPTLAFSKIGLVACTNKSSPFSMAVNRLGTAYSVFTDGQLFKISTSNAACQSTTYQPDQLPQMGFSQFGMGYASGPDGGDELFVVQVDFTNDSRGLGMIDTSAFTLGYVGAFQPDLTPECELTGTGDGRLFALCLSTESGSTLAQIDPTTAKIIGADSLTTGGGQEALAFAFWGGDFWIFTSPGTTTTVTKYDPIAKTETNMTTLNAEIVGAGVSTCAPQ